MKALGLVSLGRPSDVPDDYREMKIVSPNSLGTNSVLNWHFSTKYIHALRLESQSKQGSI